MKRLLTAIFLLLLFPTAAPAATLHPVSHVVLIMEENHSASAVTASSMPYLTSLGAQYAHATNYSAITHPSLPNYMALTAGDDLFNGSDCSPGSSCQSGADNIFHQVKTWRVWAESMPQNCDRSNADPYAVRHTAAPYFTDLNPSCPSSDVPLNPSSVPGISTGQFIFVTPNLNHDAHDGSLGAADTWLKGVVGKLLQRPLYKDGSTLIEITFDEGSGSNQQVATVFVNPRLSHLTVSTSSNHYSMLRLNEELLGVPLLSHAQNATDLRSALGL